MAVDFATSTRRVTSLFELDDSRDDTFSPNSFDIQSPTLRLDSRIMGSPLGIPISAKPGMRSYKNYGRSVASSDQADEDDVCSERSLDIGVSEKSIKVAMNTATAGVTTAARATPADTQRDSISEVSTQLGQPGSSNEGESAVVPGFSGCDQCPDLETSRDESAGQMPRIANTSPVKNCF